MWSLLMKCFESKERRIGKQLKQQLFAVGEESWVQTNTQPLVHLGSDICWEVGERYLSEVKRARHTWLLSLHYLGMLSLWLRPLSTLEWNKSTSLKEEQPWLWFMACPLEVSTGELDANTVFKIYWPGITCWDWDRWGRRKITVNTVHLNIGLC